MILTPAQKTLALTLALQGELVDRICSAVGVTVSVWYHARVADPAFADAFLLAQRDGAERMAAALVRISRRDTKRVRNAEGVLVRVAADDRRDRLAIETGQWFLRGKHPSVWGARVDVQVTASLSLAPQLKAARVRSPATSQLLEVGALAAVALSEPVSSGASFDATSDAGDGGTFEDDPAGAYR